MSDKPLPMFHVGKIVELDKKVADSGRGKITGREWGPDNKFLVAKYKGWVYYVQEIKRDGTQVQPPAGEGIGFTVGETELEIWNGK